MPDPAIVFRVGYLLVMAAIIGLVLASYSAGVATLLAFVTIDAIVGWHR